MGGSDDKGQETLEALFETGPSSTFLAADLEDMRWRLGDAAHGLQQDLDRIRGQP